MQTTGPDPELRAVLTGSESLRELSPAAVDEMFLHMEERHFQPGERLIRQGDPGDCLFLIVEGSARIGVHRRDGATDEICRLSAGEIVGEMALVTREPRMAEVVAETSMHVLALSARDFHAIAGRYLELGMVLTRLIGERLERSARDGLGDKIVNGYRILRRLGRGGMSIVYEAERTGTDERYALKMMSHRLVYQDGALMRFRREADLVGGMRHDNIARMYGRFSAYSTEFLVVELCDGSDLSRLVERKGAMDEWAVRGVLGQIASALEYVHGRGVIHRDVKPSNVILRPDGVVKLMDFGVAHAAPSAQDTTRTAPGSLFGTMTYMPPEQLAGKEVDARADIYALACLGYQLLTGRPPTAASDIVDLVQQKMSFRLPPRADIGHGVGNEMYDFLERGLSSDPAGRPESITELTAWAAPVRI